MSYTFNRAWSEINLDNIAHNARAIRNITSTRAEVMGVVKADAYGHGVLEVVETLLNNGVTRLAVSMLDEAIQLRKAGVKVPLLVLSYTDPKRYLEIIEYDITQTIFSHELAECISEKACQQNAKIKVHIKIDTGMGRVGFLPGYSAVKDVMRINILPGLIIEGLFTHFASADESDEDFTMLQFERFMGICNELSRIGVYIPIKHVANSAAILRYPQMHLDMVRAGIILYGHYPSSNKELYNIDLKPAMMLKASVTMVKSVEKSTPISYGCTYFTEQESTIATVPIGYADGYTRALSNKARVLINGEYAPIRGRVCMDQCMVDISAFKSAVNVGDEVVLFGEQNGKIIEVEELAEISGTINYEIICLIGKRIPRFYFKEGKIINVLNYLI